MPRERTFLKAIAAGKVVKTHVRGIALSEGRILVQKPTDDPHACYAFIGGQYKVGDTLEGL